MTAKELTRTALLGVFLYIVYYIGSFGLYIELVSFVLVLYGTTLKTRVAYFATVLFAILVMLTKGIGLWSIMYLIMYPQYILLYAGLAKITKNKILYYILAAVLSFLGGNIIGIPYLLTGGLHGYALLINVLMGFQVTLGNSACTVVACIFLYDTLNNLLKKILGSSMVRI